MKAKEESSFSQIEEYLESFWCLYHKPSKTLIDGLSWRQLRAIISTIGTDAITHWMVWREGEIEWGKLGDRVEKIMSAAASRLAIPPLAPEIEDGTEMATQTRTKTRPALSATHSKHGEFGIDRRMTKRFNRVVEVTVRFNGQLYKSRTKNISVMGIKLEWELPFKTEESFSVTLSLKSGPLELDCQLNQNENGMSRSQLRVLPGKNIEKLADFLAEG